MPFKDTACVRRRSTTLLASLSTLALAIFAAGAWAASETTGDTFPASVTAAGEYAQTGVDQRVSISDDGRYVAFESAAENLAGLPDTLSQAYVKDLDNGQVELASRAGGEDGEPADEPRSSNRGVEHLVISGNGRYVVFDAPADNLVAGFPPPEEEGSFSTHVYRRDLQSGETALVDRVTGVDGAIVHRGGLAEAISANGRYVVFSAEVEDLDDPGGEHEWGAQTVYVRDMLDGTTSIVSRASGEQGELADRPSSGGAISADGRYAAFASGARNLAADMESNTAHQLYRRELRPPYETTLISQGQGGLAGDGSSFEPSFVGDDGCRIGFSSLATNLAGGEAPTLGAYLRDLCATPASTTLISFDEEGEPFEEATFAGAGGGRVAFEGNNPFPGARHLYLRDLGSGQTTLVDRASGPNGEAANKEVEWGAISANGCRAAFTTQARNLTEDKPPLGGGNQPTQAFVRQLGSCKPADAAPTAETPAEAAKQASAPAPTRLRIARLNRARLVLDFSAAGTAVVKVRRLDKAPRRRWKLIKRLVAQTDEAGPVGLDLSKLPPGRYRLNLHLRGFPGHALVRWLSIGDTR